MSATQKGIVDWSNATSADGPRMAEWIKTHFPNYVKDNTCERRVNEWAAGGKADPYAVDRILTKLGGALSHTPDELWMDTSLHNRAVKKKRKPRRRSRLEPKDCERCGKPIPIRYPNGDYKTPYKWRTAQFCSAECHHKSKGGLFR